MHQYTTPQAIQNRTIKAQGRLHALDEIDAKRTAFVIIDMQNHYVAPGFPSESKSAPSIVPNINRIAEAIRAAGGQVIWIKTTAVGSRESWAMHHKYKLTEQNAERRLKSLAEDSEGFRLYEGLEPADSDLVVKKIKYSAMIPGSSDLPKVLADRNIDTILIAGTKTNVCCESTGRDASMMEFRVALVSDATATFSDEEHAAALDNFIIYFGDVLTTDETIARLTK